MLEDIKLHIVVSDKSVLLNKKCTYDNFSRFCIPMDMVRRLVSLGKGQHQRARNIFKGSCYSIEISAYRHMLNPRGNILNIDIFQDQNICCNYNGKDCKVDKSHFC